MPAVAVSALAVNTAAAGKAVIAGLTVPMPAAGLGIWQRDGEIKVQSMLVGKIAHLLEMLPSYTLRRIVAPRLYSMS